MSSTSRLALALAGSLLLAACGTSGGSSLAESASPVRQANTLVVASAAQQTINAYITGYSYWDNTPAGTAEIARPVVHSSAGGKGTYEDPVTLAVGHSIVGGRSILDVPAGTRFYIERLQRYAIVEDVCGDGPTPQNGPCHSGKNGHPWFDVYIGGERSNAQLAEACANKITDIQPVIVNPAPNLPVRAGALTETGC